MKINWKVRMKNKYFWLALIPATLLVAQIVGGWFGYELEIEALGADLTHFVEALFALFVILGIVVDPTVEGLNDSEQAMKYHKPRKDDK